MMLNRRALFAVFGGGAVAPLCPPRFASGGIVPNLESKIIEIAARSAVHEVRLKLPAMMTDAQLRFG